LTKNNTILERAKRTFELESKAIENLSDLLTDDFSKAIDCILSSKGRVVISGIGKSAAIATKIVATLNSTGTPSIFMHAADAIHGDLGTIQDEDVVICISKSGNTPEIKALVPLLKRRSNTLIAITGNPESFLGVSADFILNTYVAQEACPNNLAPTTSTSTQLAMGDALAVCLLEQRGFNASDFAKYHPGGSLGKQLYLTAGDIAKDNLKPQVDKDTTVKEVIVEISQKMLGVSPVMDQGEVIGVITDGDIRRMLNQFDDISNLKAKDIMSVSPKTIHSATLAVEVLSLMQNHNITQVLVIDQNKYKGVVHLHNLIKEGIV
jgi:arabinose-5-phosphate isomerase